MSEVSAYRAHAALLRAEAAVATLDNVRIRSERGAAVWTEMAERLEKFDTFRSEQKITAETRKRLLQPDS